VIQHVRLLANFGRDATLDLSPLSARSGHPGTPIPYDKQITVALSALTREGAATRTVSVAAAAGLPAAFVL
jgi:hypothetical protein